MSTSRTGTAQHKRWRTAVLKRDRDNGVERCPLCGVALDFEHGKQPNSAEADHIIPHKWGGQSTLDNGRTICRHCNQSRGAKLTPRDPPTHTTTLINW
jgi:5-methylcytosine-specific restriction protein A